MSFDRSSRLANFLFPNSISMCIVSYVPEIIQTADFETKIGTIRVASSERGLVYLGFPLNNGRGYGGWRQRFAPGCKTVNNESVNQPIYEQVVEFIAHERTVFEFPIDLRATAFHEKIFKIVSEIRYGETLSYKEVAQIAGDEKLVRAVGAALGANPIALVIPCHRVVGSGGKLQGYSGGIQMKARLLAAEQTGPANGRLF
ncbi:MAG: methylated-DNA--[protein]-cysteine S-methyltransferase [Myxococcales bacterium]|nr:methylated-DNA--[protein]-cysteine S-methyltransferase [Myxococcales bacterium]